MQFKPPTIAAEAQAPQPDRGRRRGRGAQRQRHRAADPGPRGPDRSRWSRSVRTPSRTSRTRSRSTSARPRSPRTTRPTRSRLGAAERHPARYGQRPPAELQLRPARTAPARARPRWSTPSAAAPTPAASPPLPGVGCVDIARSSSPRHRHRRRTAATTPAPTPIQFVPFAVDAVTGVIGPASRRRHVHRLQPATSAGHTVQATTVATELPSPRSTLHPGRPDQPLRQLHTRSPRAASRTGRLADPTVTAAAGRPADRPVHPAARVGHREVLGQATLGNFRHRPRRLRPRTIINGRCAPASANPDGVSFPVEEHDGTAVVHRPDRLRPVLHRPVDLAEQRPQRPRHGAVLQTVNGDVQRRRPRARRSTAASTPASRFTRLRLLRGDAVPADRPRATRSHSLLNGTSSTVCQRPGAIISFGFALLDATSSAARLRRDHRSASTPRRKRVNPAYR